MGALASIPILGAIVAAVVEVVDIGIATVTLGFAEALTYAAVSSMNAQAYDASMMGLAQIFDAASIGGASIKRDTGSGAKGDADVKIHFEPIDPDHTQPMRTSTFHLRYVNNSTGHVEFLWDNVTSQAYGGNMTNLWLHKDGSLKFPPIDSKTQRHVWYPNGTINGTDTEGVPIIGNWTTDLNHYDKRCFREMTAKKAAVVREKELRSQHANILSKRGTNLRKRAEEEVGYEGDDALVEALIAAHKASKSS